MKRRLGLVSGLIAAAAVVLCGLGYYSIAILQQGLEGRRVAEFAQVAGQIRQDVRQKFDEFIMQEQRRPYTDYQYFYVPAASGPGEQAAVLRSPLGDELSHGLSYGHFQIEPDGSIVTPFYAAGRKSAKGDGEQYINGIKARLIPALGGSRLDVSSLYRARQESDITWQKPVKKEAAKRFLVPMKAMEKPASAPMPIDSLDNQLNTQVMTRDISNVKLNIASNSARVGADVKEDRGIVLNKAEENYKLDQQAQELEEKDGAAEVGVKGRALLKAKSLSRSNAVIEPEAEPNAGGQVQIKIEPFVPLAVKSEREQPLGGDVYLLRHVQIGERHIVQGFELDQGELVKLVSGSAQKMLREGMSFEVGDGQESEAYRAVLDFGFGDLVVNLIEEDPGRIAAEVTQLRYWYFGIVAAVLGVSGVTILSLWRNVRAQLRLAQKKDDFISAVSHELRTPLASIRMYSEMLEKNWVKSEEKKSEYYSSMRQESERLSRLIENVLDFARIQKGRKSFDFKAGNINAYVEKTVEMMRPCAEQAGFEMVFERGEVNETVFDADAAVQITVNLIDNAIKYGRGGEKKIKVRTGMQDGYVFIEVRDSGPGIAKSEQARVFEEFYRVESESTRSTTGTGLGLALVKKFAEAHGGFVKIATGSPTGAVFTVFLAGGVEAI